MKIGPFALPSFPLLKCVSHPRRLTRELAPTFLCRFLRMCSVWRFAHNHPGFETTTGPMSSFAVQAAKETLRSPTYLQGWTMAA